MGVESGGSVKEEKGGGVIYIFACMHGEARSIVLSGCG